MASTRLAAALAMLLAPAACTLDFDRYDPTGASRDDSSAAGDGQGSGGDALPIGDDGGLGEAGLDDGPPMDVSSDGWAPDGDPSTGNGDASCVPSPSCLMQAAACGAGCSQTYQQCLSHCMSHACRQACKHQQQACGQACTTTCDGCTQSAGCPAPAACAMAVVHG